MKRAEFRTRILLAAVMLLCSAGVCAQSRPVAIVGGTLIDGTGRPAVEDAAIVIRDGRFQEVGRREQCNYPEAPR